MVESAGCSTTLPKPPRQSYSLRPCLSSGRCSGQTKVHIVVGVVPVLLPGYALPGRTPTGLPHRRNDPRPSARALGAHQVSRTCAQQSGLLFYRRQILVWGQVGRT
eukprot:706042-Pyramimonas_sp.AAC.1